MNHLPNERVWKSYVWYEDQCFFVSTIRRDFDTAIGTVRGMETLVWEYDWNTTKRGTLIFQGGGVVDHQVICRSIIASGNPEKEDN